MTIARTNMQQQIEKSGNHNPRKARRHNSNKN